MKARGTCYQCPNRTPTCHCRNPETGEYYCASWAEHEKKKRQRYYMKAQSIIANSYKGDEQLKKDRRLRSLGIRRRGEGQP